MNSPRQEAIKTSALSILGNLVLALTKGIAGILGNSYALIADAIESTTDVFSSILVLLGLRYSTKPPDDKHPYGHGRAEPLITFTVVIFLVISAGIIAYESILHIQTPHKIPKPFTLIVLGGIVILKEIFYRFVKNKGDKTKSSSLQADAWHHRSDAITSLMAFIGISIAIFMGKGYETADDWAALLAAGIILYNAYLILRPALGEVMDEHVHEDLIEDIRKVAESLPGVKTTEKCFVRKTGMTFFVDLHIAVNGEISVTKGHEIAHRTKNKIMDEFPQILDVLIHVEPF